MTPHRKALLIAAGILLVAALFVGLGFRENRVEWTYQGLDPEQPGFNPPVNRLHSLLPHVRPDSLRQLLRYEPADLFFLKPQ